MQDDPQYFELDDNFDGLEQTILNELSEAIPFGEGELRTDLSLLAIGVGVIAGMLGSYVVNNIPTLKEVRGRLNREQVLQIEEALKSAVFDLRVERKRVEMIEQAKAHLVPPENSVRLVNKKLTA